MDEIPHEVDFVFGGGGSIEGLGFVLAHGFVLDEESHYFLETGGEFAERGFGIGWNGGIGEIVGPGLTCRRCRIEELEGRHFCGGLGFGLIVVR